MSKGIKQILKEQTKDLLSDASLTTIEEAFNSGVEKKATQKATLQVEAALVQQDEEYTDKLSSLLERIDEDMTSKLQRVVEAIDKDRSGKLMSVVKKYEHALTNEASTYKEELEGNLSKFLEVYLEKIAPDSMIQEAVNNKRATHLLSELRNFLAVNDALSKDSIRGAVLDGKRQLSEKNNTISKLEEQIGTLTESLGKTSSELLVEKKTNGMQTDKKKYMSRVLKGKSTKFINENCDYVSTMFDKDMVERKQIIKEEAQKRSVSAGVDRPIVEKTEPRSPATEDEDLTRNLMEGYAEEIKKSRML